MAKDYQTYLREHPDRLADVAFTLSSRRERLKIRSYGVASCTEELKFHPGAKAVDATKVAFVFTGQGAQWVRMGKQLILHYPSVRTAIRKMDGFLQELEHAPVWTIEGAIFNFSF